MNIIRVHQQSRKRILIANVLTMMVMVPFAYGIAWLADFQGPGMWVACIVFAVNMAMFGWNTWNVARQSRDFVCLLTNERLVCQSPDEYMARSFDVPVDEIVKLAEVEQSEGAPRLSVHTRTGESITLTYNFGNPAKSFFKELRNLLPLIPVEKC